MSKMLPWSMILLLLIGTGVHAAGMKWDHEENIKQGIALFDDAYKQGGMTEAENLSKKCHKKFSKDSQLLELCASMDISAMMVDAQMAPQPSLQRKYFQVGTVDGRLRKELVKLGHNKKVQEDIVTFWGATTTKLLNAQAAAGEKSAEEAEQVPQDGKQ